MFSEWPTDVSYLPVPGTLQRAGVGRREWEDKGTELREVHLERWRLTHSILMVSYTCRRYVMEFYFSVFVSWAKCPEATNSCLKSIVYSGCSAKDCTAQFGHELGSWFAASNTIAPTISQITKCARIPSADFSQSQVGLAHLGQTVIICLVLEFGVRISREAARLGECEQRLWERIRRFSQPYASGS